MAAPAHAELYKWTDAQGKVHYTDQPPTQDAKQLKQITSPPAPPPKAAESLDEQEQAYQKRKKEADEARAKADKEAEAARIKQENCAQARKNLDTLQNSPLVARTAGGRPVYLSDPAQRASAIAESQQAVSKYCE